MRDMSASLPRQRAKAWSQDGNATTGCMHVSRITAYITKREKDKGGGRTFDAHMHAQADARRVTVFHVSHVCDRATNVTSYDVIRRASCVMFACCITMVFRNHALRAPNIS